MRTFALFIIALTLASPVNADWQYTQWGMTEAEVIKASGNNATLNISTKYDYRDHLAKLTGTYDADGHTFGVLFFFGRNSGALKRIRLSPNEKARCHHLIKKLVDVYGAQEKTRSALFDVTVWTSHKWWDRDNRNVIEVTDGTTDCFITYSEMETAGKEGGW